MISRKNNNYICPVCRDKGIDVSFWTQHLLSLHIKEYHTSDVKKPEPDNLKNMRRTILTLQKYKWDGSRD